MNTYAPDRIAALLVVLASAGLDLAAQDDQAPAAPAEGRVRIEVIRSENGKEQRTTREFDLSDGQDIEDALHELGVMDLDRELSFDLTMPAIDMAPLDDIRTAFAMPHFRWAPEAPQEDHGYLGVQYADGEQHKGAKVTEVLDDTPAAKAGLRKDDVIIAIDGEPLGCGGDLAQAISGHPPGTKVKVEYLRGKQRKTATVELAPLPQVTAWSWDGDMDFDMDLPPTPPNAPGMVRAPARAYLGILGGGEEDGATGVVIGEVMEGSPAENMGLEQGDLIQRINGETVATFGDVVRIIGAQEPGAAVQLDFLRGQVPHSTKGELGQQEAIRFERSAPAMRFRGMPRMDDIDREEMRRDMEQLRADMEHLRHELRGEVRSFRGRHEAVAPSAEEKKELGNKGVKGLDRTLELPDLRASLSPDGQRLRLVFEAPQRGDLAVALHDHAGKAVYQEEITAYKGRYERTVDVSELATGTYFLVIHQNGAATARKVVKD